MQPTHSPSAPPYYPEAPQAVYPNLSANNNFNAYRAEISQKAQEANAFAKSVLGEKPAPHDSSSNNNTSPSLINVHHYNWCSPYWWYPQPYSFFGRPIFLDSGYGRRDRGYSKADAQRFLLGLAAVVGSGIAAIAIGASFKRLTGASEEIKRTNDFKTTLENSENEHLSESNQMFLNEAKTGVSLKGRICNRIKNSTLADLTLRIGAFVGCAMVIIGLLALAKYVLVAGVALTAVTTTGILLKWIIESAVKSNINDAYALQASVVRLNNL